MPALLSYSCCICREIHRTLIYTCAICQQSSFSHMPYVNRYKGLLITFVPNASTLQFHVGHTSADTLTPYLYVCLMPALLSYTFAVHQHIHGPLSYTCAKCQPSSVTHVPYVNRYRDPLVILAPNASTTQLHMCHISADKDTRSLYLGQMPTLLISTCTICRQIQRRLIYTCFKCNHSPVTRVPHVDRYIDHFVMPVPNASALHFHMCHMSAVTKTH